MGERASSNEAENYSNREEKGRQEHSRPERKETINTEEGETKGEGGFSQSARKGQGIEMQARK